MAKGISSGVEKLVTIGKKDAGDQREQLTIQWRDLRNRLDSLLLANNVLATDEARRNCLRLDDMTHQQRIDHIKNHWGPQYLTKAMPLLQQLQTLETHLVRLQDKK